MGTDLDFTLELKKNKLVCTQFQQPVNQLDAFTQPTQQPNAEFILQLIRMLQNRFGNRQNNDNEGPIAVVIQLGDNQRLVIAFPNQQRQTLPEPPRERPFQRMMRQILEDGNDRIEDAEFRQMRRHHFRERMRELQEPQRERMEEIRQQIPEVQYEDRDWDMNLGVSRRQHREQAEIQRRPQEEQSFTLQQSVTVLSQLQPREDELRHQERAVQNEFQDRIQKIQEQPKKNNNKLSQQCQFSPNPQSKQELQPNAYQDNKQERNLHSFQSINALYQTLIPFSRTSVHPANSIGRPQKPAGEEEVSCWQAFVRMMSNIFKPRSS